MRNLLLALLTLAGCSSGASQPPPAAVCAPGHWQGCLCPPPATSYGQQFCNDAGTAWEAECHCSAPPDAGWPDAGCAGCWGGGVCNPGNTSLSCGLHGVSCMVCGESSPCVDGGCQ